MMNERGISLNLALTEAMQHEPTIRRSVMVPTFMAAGAAAAVRLLALSLRHLLLIRCRDKIIKKGWNNQIPEGRLKCFKYRHGKCNDKNCRRCMSARSEIMITQARLRSETEVTSFGE